MTETVSTEGGTARSTRRARGLRLDHVALGRGKEPSRDTCPGADVRADVDHHAGTESASLERLENIFGRFESVGRHPADMEARVRRQPLNGLAEAMRRRCIPGSH